MSAAAERITTRILDAPDAVQDEVVQVLAVRFWALVHSVCGPEHCEYRRPLRCDDSGLHKRPATDQERAANQLSRTALRIAAQRMTATTTDDYRTDGS